MTKLITLRAVLLSTGVSLSTFGIAAAQSPVSFPDLAPEQIASDVTQEYNPRTGQRELSAAPFDPFETDAQLAASVRLTSADGAIDLNGNAMGDGALLDMDFFYNAPSSDPYGGRGYNEAVFLSGDYAPITRRDGKVLECSTRIENVVYDERTYYAPGYARSYGGLFRPYRHYRGHSGFGFGFGHGYGSGYGSGYHDSWRRKKRKRKVDPRPHRRVGEPVHRPTYQPGTDLHLPKSKRRRVPISRTLDDHRKGSGNTADRRRDDRRTDRPDRRSEPRPERRSERRSEPLRKTRKAERRERPVSRPREDLRVAPTPRPRSQPKPKRVERSQPKPVSRPKPAKRTKSEPRRERPVSRSPRNENRAKVQYDFFPGDAYGGRSVISSRSVDCARQDSLRVFIPAARLDAARFDGLTVLVLDRDGYETPVFIPPNYIEGFRMAATGQVTPRGYTPQVAPGAGYQTPSYGGTSPDVMVFPSTRDAAPCPSGTIPQANGTCLQN